MNDPIINCWRRWSTGGHLFLIEMRNGWRRLDRTVTACRFGSGGSFSAGTGRLTRIQLRRKNECGDDEREEQDPAAATAEGPEATARATNHDGPALGDPDNRLSNGSDYCRKKKKKVFRKMRQFPNVFCCSSTVGLFLASKVRSRPNQDKVEESLIVLLGRSLIEGLIEWPITAL